MQQPATGTSATGTPTPATPAPGKTKKRHGCLTTWLIIIIIANIIVTFLNAGLLSVTEKVPGWAIPVYAIIGVFNVVCAIALFMWKKWGFYGFCASAIVAIIANIAMGVNPFSAISSVIGIAILYGVLNIGKENKGWTQLE
jgi:hypothetical protein